jgi:hypothetical protein
MEDNDDTQISVFSDMEFHQAIGIYLLLECELQLQADRDNTIAYEKCPKKKLHKQQTTSAGRALIIGACTTISKETTLAHIHYLVNNLAYFSVLPDLGWNY